ncbi:Hypothetical protein PMT_2707 [Prochlorococcus marinus str. MIT 9313]|uniref:Uncharacterized protein n=1 Tax=Prochlorococcus marinus (strain MIT 9313) TaxID=74547 RepID=B9ES90_PROMM|nr:Hypothetical protein PMT_2707 [Prochlorococcus marinus str. MIT 9313]
MHLGSRTRHQFSTPEPLPSRPTQRPHLNQSHGENNALTAFLSKVVSMQSRWEARTIHVKGASI